MTKLKKSWPNSRERSVRRSTTFARPEPGTKQTTSSARTSSRTKNSWSSPRTPSSKTSRKPQNRPMRSTTKVHASHYPNSCGIMPSMEEKRIYVIVAETVPESVGDDVHCPEALCPASDLGHEDHRATQGPHRCPNRACRLADAAAHPSRSGDAPYLSEGPAQGPFFGMVYRCEGACDSSHHDDCARRPGTVTNSNSAPILSARRGCIYIHSMTSMRQYTDAGRVMTAVCTEPVEPEKLYGITDYLELWG